MPKLLSTFCGTPDIPLQNSWVLRKPLQKTLLYRVIISSNKYYLSFPFGSFYINIAHSAKIRILDSIPQ